VPITFWHPQIVLCLIAPESESARAWTDTPSSHLVTLQRLRC
jgi:hypothetical protein